LLREAARDDWPLAARLLGLVLDPHRHRRVGISSISPVCAKALPYDAEAAVAAYARGSRLGDAVSTTNLASCLYERGEDPVNVHRWFLLAARQGVAHAQFRVAEHLLVLNSPTDRDALEWLALAARQRHAEALFSLFLSLRRAASPSTAVLARHALVHAAHLGFGAAEFVLARSLDDGLDEPMIPCDPELAREWYARPDVHLNARAQLVLARCLRDGLAGISPDLVEAETWLSRAVALSEPDAEGELESLRSSRSGGTTSLLSRVWTALTTSTISASSTTTSRVSL
jgi:TPR repeat protein